MQGVICGVCVAYQDKQTNKASRANPFAPRRTNKQTCLPRPPPALSLLSPLLLVCFQLFAFMCHIFISVADCLSIVFASDRGICELHLYICIYIYIDCHLQAGKQPALSSLSAYPFDTFSHLSPRLLLALIAFSCDFFRPPPPSPSPSPLPLPLCLVLPHLLCRI